HRDLKPANVLLAGNPKSQNPNHQQIPNPKDRNPKRGGQEVSDIGDSDLRVVGDLGFEIWNFTPKVCDFGLAKQLDVEASQTCSGMMVGTPGYMAPEQAAGGTAEVGPAADIHALGVILYELLTGRRPFAAAIVLDALEQVRSHEPPSPDRLQPKLPR